MSATVLQAIPSAQYTSTHHNGANLYFPSAQLMNLHQYVWGSKGIVTHKYNLNLATTREHLVSHYTAAETASVSTDPEPAWTW